MAELTNLESKLGEVLGLAQAAQKATKKIASLVEDESVKSTLEQMHEEAAETERRATEIASNFDGKKTAIEEKGRETRSEAEEMMSTYLDDDADGLDGLEFLTMAEAGELGHVAIVQKMNERAGNAAGTGVRRVGAANSGASLRAHARRRRWCSPPRRTQTAPTGGRTAAAALTSPRE